MEIKNDTTVGEIVRVNFKAAQLFDKYNIDFCCGGAITVSEACKETGTSIDGLVDEIETLLKVKDPESKYIEGLGLDKLCDYIVDRHHSYVNENIPFLQQKLQKLCDVHGTHHPELFEINKLFEAMAGNLAAHMKKEELILFPLLSRMARNQNENRNMEEEIGKVKETIAELESEHQSEGERLGTMAKLSGNYSVPPDGCNTFQVTYRTLLEFEQDLHRHIHLENNILFRKAITPLQ